MIDEAEVIKQVRYIEAAYLQHSSIRVSTHVVNEIVDDFIKFARQTRPLATGDQGVVSLHQPKIAALFADRIWLPYAGEEPELDFAFGWQSPMGIRWSAMMALWRFSEDYEADLAAAGGSSTKTEVRHFMLSTCRELAADYRHRTGAAILPMYHSTESRDADYSSGDHTAVVAIIQNLEVADEDQLTWDQVIEFRKDETSRAAYRRFIHWLDRDMIDKSVQYITEEVAQRLEDYEWSLHKHGIKTVIGALSNTLNPKSLFATSTAGLTVNLIAAKPIWSLLAAGGLLVGRAALSTATALIERRDIEMANREIAYVQQIKRAIGRAE